MNKVIHLKIGKKLQDHCAENPGSLEAFVELQIRQMIAVNKCNREDIEVVYAE